MAACGCDHDCRDYTCHLCGVPAHAMSGIADHMRLYHPDVDAEPARGPDGELVVDGLALRPRRLDPMIVITNDGGGAGG